MHTKYKTACVLLAGAVLLGTVLCAAGGRGTAPGTAGSDAGAFSGAALSPAPSAAAAADSEAAQRLLRANGVLYRDTGLVSTEPRCGMLDGQVTAALPAGQTPAQDGEANFACEGAGYQLAELQLQLYWQGEWHIFLPDGAELLAGG